MIFDEIQGANMRQTLFEILGISFLLAACGTLMPTPNEFPPMPSTEALTSVPTKGHLPNVDWLAYHDGSAGFSIQHPLTWQKSDADGYPVVFTLEAAPGTTLINKTMEINVTKNITDCKEKTYTSETGTTSPANVTVNGISFLKEQGSGIGAGNIYDWMSYSTIKGSTCINLTFVLHSANAGVYSTEPAPFDKAAESEVFDELLNTFKFDQ
jgi:hypothetical protein